jgi:hypothetical protein
MYSGFDLLYYPGDQKVTNFGGQQKQDFVKCLKINNLQSLVVPRMGALTF